MEEYETKIKKYISEKGINAEHLSFDESCHSVAEAVEAAQADPHDFIKNICLISKNDDLIVAIVKGEDRVSRSKIAKVLEIDRPRIASPEEILDKVGYPCGGTPSFGYQAHFIIDPKVMERSLVYSGGGSTHSLIKMNPDELKKANQGLIFDIVQ